MIKNKIKRGFTILELLVVVAIIGIFTSVVIVSLMGPRDQARRASALTSVSSAMTEIILCGDDGEEASEPVAGEVICGGAGYTATWPELSGGYSYGTPSGTLAGGDYSLTVSDGVAPIVCTQSSAACE